MLLYSYFTRKKKEQRRQDEERPTGRDASNHHDNVPHLTGSDDTDVQQEKEHIQASPSNGVQNSKSPPSHNRPSHVPGMAPMTSHSSSTSAQLKAEYPDAETRAKHKYTVRRPRALQFSYHSQVITAAQDGGVLSPTGSHGEVEKSEISSHLPEAIARQRERLDLFIDLIWVGIIGNLSEVFSTIEFTPEYSSESGLAILVFILVFLPSWRIWNAMREFLNNYYMDDMVQRIFQFWVLVLSVFYGNQLAYLAEDINSVKNWCITTYLIILASFLIIELVYSIWIPWLRRLCLFSVMIRLPGIGLWIASNYLDGSKAIGTVVAAICWEYICPLVMDSSLADRLTPSEYRKALDVTHFQNRMANFFIIVLGEGVLQLIKDGPLGKGLNAVTGIMVWVLLIYFAFSFIYFIRDGSRTYIPAVRHKGWRFLIFVFWHIPLFSSLLTFVAGVMFIIRHAPLSNYEQKGEAPLTEEEKNVFLYDAVWTCAGSLAVTMLSMLIISLLDISLDERGTLRIDNRYIRLSGRAIYIVIILCVPAARDITAPTFLIVAGLLLVVLVTWEWNACLEKGGGFLEPRGLTLMMNSELKGKGIAVVHGDAPDDHHHRGWTFSGPLARI